MTHHIIKHTIYNKAWIKIDSTNRKINTIIELNRVNIVEWQNTAYVIVGEQQESSSISSVFITQRRL